MAEEGQDMDDIQIVDFSQTTKAKKKGKKKSSKKSKLGMLHLNQYLIYLSYS